MQPPKPEICPYCLEEDDNLIWDKEGKEWICELCMEAFEEKIFEDDEAFRHSLDEEGLD
jgi:uncharacterized radical SAM superfamily Fe-S cluster-containing enzyme